MKNLIRIVFCAALAVASLGAQTIYQNVQRGSATALANTRIPFSDSSGRLVDDADLTFVTDTLTATKGTFGGVTHISNAIGSANSVTSVALSPLTLGTGTSGTALSFASATNIATFSAGIVGTSATLSSLTATRVPFAGTAGLLSDDADLTFAADTLTFTKGLAPTSLMVGNGTAANLLSALTVYDTGTSLPRGISNVQVSSGTDSANFSGYKARGTPGSLTTIVTGDLLANIRAWGYDGSNYINSGSIRWTSEGTVASTRVPSKAEIMVSTDAAPSVLTTSASFSGKDGISLTAVGTNQSITLNPSGTGITRALSNTNSGSPGLTIENSGSAEVNFQLKRTAGTTATWTGYIPTSSAQFRFYNGSDRVVIGTTGNLLLGGLTTDDGVNSLQITGGQAMSGKINTYNGLATAGNGVVTVQGAGRSAAQTAAVGSVAAYTVGAADASFEVSANVLVTTSTTHNFTTTVAYTDESNVARTLTLSFSSLAGTFLTAITNITGAGPYEGVPMHIRCKASTAITVATTGTFTTVTYNVEGVIMKLQ